MQDFLKVRLLCHCDGWKLLPVKHLHLHAHLSSSAKNCRANCRKDAGEVLPGFCGVQSPARKVKGGWCGGQCQGVQVSRPEVNTNSLFGPDIPLEVHSGLLDHHSEESVR